MKTRDLVLAAIFAALTGILSLIIIPLPTPVPFTLQILVVTVAGAILGSKVGFLSQLTYVLLGAIGVPVFAGGNAGIGVLTGPTGGYLIGFVVAAFIIGKIIENVLPRVQNEVTKYIVILTAMLAGLVVIHLIGVVQLSVVTEMGLSTAIAKGCIPFLIFDTTKVLLGSVVAYFVRSALIKANLLQVHVSV